MKNNLVTKVSYRSIFCATSFFTILIITGFFSMYGHDGLEINEDALYYYTNYSNYLCFGVMLACLIDDAKQLRSGRLLGHTRSPYLRHLKFISTPIIALTFLANGLLLGDPTTLRFWSDMSNLFTHVVCPVMFILDTLLFDEHKRIGYLDPFLSCVLPLIYVLITVPLGTKTGRYPYFFLDLGELGWGGLLMWVGILLVLFVILGYILFIYDKLVKVEGKWKLDFSNTPAFGFTQKA